MKQALAIFKKDVRHLWLEVLASFAVLTVLVWIVPSQWPWNYTGAVSYSSPGAALRSGAMFAAFGPDGSLLSCLLLLSWVILISRLIHTERLVGNTQFWITRPYEWPELLVAKLLFLTLIICAPFILAQCLLLARAGFNPANYIGDLAYNFLLILGALIAPLLAFVSLTSGFGKLLLAIVGLILYFGVGLFLASRFPLQLVNRPSGPVGDELEFILLLCGASTIVLVQYARRKTRVAWLLMILTILLITMVGILSPDRWLMNRNFPLNASNAPDPVSFVLGGDGTDYTFAVWPTGNKNLLQVSIPLRVQGLKDGFTLKPVAYRMEIDTPSGVRWDSSWTLAYSPFLLADRPEALAEFPIRRTDYDRLRTTPVTLHLSIAIVEAVSEGTTQVPLKDGWFSVPNIGRCAPQPGFPNDRRSITGIYCLWTMHSPGLTYVSAQWVEGDIPCVPGNTDFIRGSGWVGDLDTSPASLEISPVAMHPLNLSNGLRTNRGDGRSFEWRHLCEGSPIFLATYRKVADAQTVFTMNHLQLPAPADAGTNEVRVIGNR